MPAALGASPAGLDAFVHPIQALAIICAFFANFRALTACMLVMISANEHEVCRRAADFRAGHHETEVPGLDVTSALLQAVVHC